MEGNEVLLCFLLIVLLPGRDEREYRGGEVCDFSFTGIETEQEMKRKGSWHYLTAGFVLCNLSMRKEREAEGRMCQHFAAQKGRKWLFSPFYNKLFQRGRSDKSKSFTFCKHNRCTYNWRKWQMLAVLTFSSTLKMSAGSFQTIY